MRIVLLVAAVAAILQYVGSAHAQPGKPGYESAVCACRSYGHGPDKWAACMKSRGHKWRLAQAMGSRDVADHAADHRTDPSE